MKRLAVIVLAAGVALSAIYGALVYYDDYFPYGRMWETPAVRPHEKPLLVMEKGLAPVGGGEAFFRDENAAGMVSPLDAGAPETLDRGKKVYAVYCVFCHGERHDGMGTVGQSFFPLPTNLRSKEVMGKSDGALFYEISFGSTRAPALATTLSITDRWAVIHYLRSLKTDPEALSRTSLIDTNEDEK